MNAAPSSGARRLAVAAILLLALVPFWMRDTFYINVASQVLVFAVLALALNILVGFGGLVSLGHAGLFAISAYTAALTLQAGHGHAVACLVALSATLAASAVFGALALRSTGIVFLMITVALGQIVWGVVQRWTAVTNGDNGINVSSRPRPFGWDLASAQGYYVAAFVVFLVALVCITVYVRSPLGVGLRATRDQPRRMDALGFNVWMIRFLALMLSGFWTGVAGLLFLYYNQFVSPSAASLQFSAEALLMVIAGGSATLLGPIAGAVLVVVMKSVISAYVERWSLFLGIVFVLIVSVMPDGLVPGLVRLWKSTGPGSRPAEAMAALRAKETRG